MPHKVQKLCVDLTLSRVSCPGVWLRSNNELYLSICLFGRYQRTSLTEPVFPVIFMERFKFEKVFYDAVDPAEVSDMLEDEDVLFELIQLAPDEPDGAILLATYQRNVRDFLYPYPQLLPAYGSSDREVLMEKTWDFPGIAPKIEFGSHAKLKEIKVPKQKSGSKKHSLQTGRSRRPRSPSPRTFVYPDTEEEEKGYQEPTVASITRSRSLSPSQRAKLRSVSARPQFLVRRMDDTLIHRVPGIKKERRKHRTRSARSPVLLSPRTRTCDKVTRTRIPPDYYSDEESELEYLGSYRRMQTRSMPETVLPPRRPLSPVAVRRSLRERYLDNESDVEAWRRMRVERAEKALTESLMDSYRTRSVLSYDSLDELANDFDRSRLFGY